MKERIMVHKPSRLLYWNNQVTKSDLLKMVVSGSFLSIKFLYEHILTLCKFDVCKFYA